MMTITHKSALLDVPMHFGEKLPGGMAYAEYDLIVKAYMACIGTNYPVATPTFPMIRDKYLSLNANEIAEHVATEHLSNESAYSIASDDDATSVLNTLFDEFYDWLTHRNFEWYIVKALEHANLCYVDSDIDCCPKSCKDCDLCQLEFVIINSPQFNMVPIRGGVHVCKEYVLNPLKENIWYHQYSTHYAKKTTQSCLFEDLKEDYEFFELEMFETFNNIVKGVYFK